MVKGCLQFTIIHYKLQKKSINSITAVSFRQIRLFKLLKSSARNNYKRINASYPKISFTSLSGIHLHMMKTGIESKSSAVIQHL